MKKDIKNWTWEDYTSARQDCKRRIQELETGLNQMGTFLEMKAEKWRNEAVEAKPGFDRKKAVRQAVALAVAAERNHQIIQRLLTTFGLMTYPLDEELENY